MHSNGLLVRQLDSINLVSSGTATDVQEVGGRSPVQLDDVHGGHGQTSTVNLNYRFYSFDLSNAFEYA